MKWKWNTEHLKGLIMLNRRFPARVIAASVLYRTVKVRRRRRDAEFLKQSVRFRIHHQQPGLSSSTSDQVHHLGVPQTLNASAIHLNTHTYTEVLNTVWPPGGA